MYESTQKTFKALIKVTSFASKRNAYVHFCALCKRFC